MPQNSDIESPPRPRNWPPAPDQNKTDTTLATVNRLQTNLWDFIAETESDELSLDPHDRGNWTSGIIGIGTLKGSKYGVSAATFPDVDIAAMTYDGARTICMTHFWPAVYGDLLVKMHSPALAMMLTDTAWNSGPVEAIQLLQHALEIKADGMFGNNSKAVLARALEADPRWHLDTGEACLLADYSAERLLFMSRLPGWEQNKGGWTRRVMRLQSLVHPLIGGFSKPSA